MNIWQFQKKLPKYWGQKRSWKKDEEKCEIFEEFAPRPGKMIFEKNVNAPFHPMTGLTENLLSKKEKDIIAVGEPTDYCFDATVKSGFEEGFHILIPADANSTYDNS